MRTQAVVVVVLSLKKAMVMVVTRSGTADLLSQKPDKTTNIELAVVRLRGAEEKEEYLMISNGCKCSSQRRMQSVCRSRQTLLSAKRGRVAATRHGQHG
jgi:hypothetical protein